MTDKRLMIMFGYVVIVGLFALSFATALGKVTEQTSYGLQGMVNGICTLGGLWAGWLFGKSNEKE